MENFYNKEKLVFNYGGKLFDGVLYVYDEGRLPVYKFDLQELGNNVLEQKAVFVPISNYDVQYSIGKSWFKRKKYFYGYLFTARSRTISWKHLVDSSNKSGLFKTDISFNSRRFKFSIDDGIIMVKEIYDELAPTTEYSFVSPYGEISKDTTIWKNDCIEKHVKFYSTRSKF